MNPETNDIYKIKNKTIYKVIILHVIFILFLSFQSKSFKSHKNQKIVINNIIETPPLKEVLTTPVKEILTTKEATLCNQIDISSLNKKNEKPKITIPKKTISHVKKSPPSLEKSTATKTNPKSNNFDNLINKLEKQISQMENNETKVQNENELLIPKNVPITKSNKELLIPKKITLNIDDQTTLSFPGIKELLIKELHENLNLPEYGDVKVSFTILPNGDIQDVVILEYQSNENQKYLKNNLSELSFKSIKKMFDEPQKFIVTFKNE